MKRLFVLFAVFAFTACTSEEQPAGPDPLNEEAGTPTFATFTFNAADAATKSSMITDENETNVINDVRVFIFSNVTGDIEMDTSLTTSPGNSMITIPILSGSKRIFAIANAGNGMLPVKGSNFTYADINNTTKLAYKTYYAEWILLEKKDTAVDNFALPALYSLNEETDTSLSGRNKGARLEKERRTKSIVKKNYFREERAFL
ncbi:MAG: hypothetical protein LBU37_10845 [Tannerellaceae bacterium]|jgi:hypothetical protein|nr:hypothetical protein [Tannerellaceae bacterium]